MTIALTLLVALAVLAPTGQASESASHEAERAARQALHQAEKDTIRLQREGERAARKAARKLAREPERLAHKEKLGNVVKISCTNVTIEYNGFPEAAGNSSVEYLSLKPEGKETVSSPSVTFPFAGSKAIESLPIVAPQGRSMIDVHAKWKSNGYTGNFDIHGPVECAAAPNFAVEKLQAVEGGTLSSAPTTGAIGQTVTYEVIVTNTGNTLLTFSEFADHYCDAGTVSVNGEGAREPGQQTTFFCTHKLTEEDEKAGSITNVATVKGTPEEGEGPTETKASNPVVVTVKAEPEPTSKGEVLGTKTTSNPPGDGGSTGSAPTSGKTGVLGFASAIVPALHGPQGCVRSKFTASMRSAGVASVTFYLDGHKLRTLSYKNAHKGLLTIVIDGSKLKVGVHKLMAKVTMKATSPTARAAKASRALMIIRCKSAVLTPRFTG